MAGSWESRLASQPSMLPEPVFSFSRKLTSFILHSGPTHRGWYRSPPTLPYNIFEQDAFDLLCLKALRAPGFYKPPVPFFPKPERQGNFFSSSRPAPSPISYYAVFNPNNPVDGIDLRLVDGDYSRQITWEETGPTTQHWYRLVTIPPTGEPFAEVPLSLWRRAAQNVGRLTPCVYPIYALPPHFPRSYPPPRRLRPERQGNSTTNIYGNDNRVTTDVGANGWTPTVTTSVGDNPIASTTENTPSTSNMGGSSTAPKSNVKTSSGGNSSGSRYSKWWEPAAARGLERALEHGIALGEKVVGGASQAIGAGVDHLRGKLAGPGPVQAANLLAVAPSSNMHGNTEIQSQAPSCNVIAYPPTPSVPLPNPDLPSEPGPSGDRAWLIDTFTWASETAGEWLSGKQAYLPEPSSYPPKPEPNSASAYPLPWALVTAQPDSVWSMMYRNHSYWNAGFRVQLTVNGSQFHAGCLILYAVPEGTAGIGGGPYEAIFTYPYALLNLATGNTCTLELPYISVTPNSSTSFLHAPWVVVVSVLSPLAPPSGGVQALQCSLYCTPLNSSFYGLRYPDKQHIKTRHVPGSGAFGTAVSGQEIPLVGVNAAQPPSDFLPGRVHNWLEFASRPGLFQTSAWTMADEPGQQLALAPISPDALASVSTPLGFALTLFSQWRGEIKLQLLFTGSAQHYGRLAVCYTPPAPAPPSSMEEAMHGTYTIWDINGNSTLDFTIPFMSQSYWKTVDIATPSGLIGNNGYVSVWVINPLSGPVAAPPSALVQSFVFAGDTFRLRFQQAPALGWQAGEEGAEAPATLDTLENGVPDTSQSPQTTFNWSNSDLPPDTILENFFSFFRYWPLQDGGGPLQVPVGRVISVPLDPSTAMSSDVLQMLRCFTYFKADVRINFRITSAIQNFPTTFCVGLVPAGATVPPGIAIPIAATFSLSDFTLVDMPIPTSGSYEVSVSLPYTSPQSVLFTTFNGWESWDGKRYGTLHSNTFGTLFFYSVGQSSPGVNQYLDVTAWISFGNFQGFCPRAPPGLGPLPNVSMVKTGANLALQKVDRTLAFARRQALDEDDFYEDLPEFLPEDDWIEPSDLFLSDHLYVVKVPRMTYVHWALRYVRWDGYTKQISLQNAGGYAVVGYEEPEGEPVHEISVFLWERVRRMVGSTYPYSATSNCSTFVSDISGYPCSNTGLSLGIGIGALGTLALAGAVCAQTHTAQRQGLGDLAAASKVITQPNVDNAFRIANRGIQSVDRAAESIQAASVNLLHASANVNLERVVEAAEHIETAADRIATSLDGASDTIRGLGSFFPSEGNIFSKFFAWLARIFGYLLILFGSPTPMSIAGLLLVICADLSPYASKFFQTSGDIFSSMFHWIATKLGYSVTPEESAEAAAGLATQQGVKDFNDGMTAIRHTDWLIEKIANVIERLLKWLEGRGSSDPVAVFSQQEPKYLQLYSDSIKALHSPPHLVDVKSVESNAELAGKLHQLAMSAKSQHHAQLASQALRNYSQITGKATVSNPGSRPEPVVVYISGPPGCGKSVVASLLATVLAARLGAGPDDYYAPSSPDCQYYDGYTGQPVHLIDDIGQDPEGRDWADFVNLVSTAPFIVPMASLEQKGTYYTSKVIIATSNFQGPNERSARSLAALDRRLLCRLEVKTIGASFDIKEALTPCGPASKYFLHETPLTRLEANNISFSVRSQISCNLETLDDLVDLILDQVVLRQRNHLQFKSLVKQGASDAYSAVYSTSLDEVSIKISQNEDPEKISPLIKWKTPIFFTAAFLSVLASVTVIFYYVRKIIHERKPDAPQAAYAGQPLVSKPTPAKRTKVMTSSAHRQGGDLSPAIPGISANVVKVKATVGGRTSSMSGTFIASRYLVTASHLVVEGGDIASEIRVGDSVYSLSEIPWAVDGELAIFKIPGREYRSLTRFFTPDFSFKSGFLISAVMTGSTFVRMWNVRRTPLHIEDVIEEDDALLYECSSFSGLCGSPVILNDPSGVRIVGIHVAGVSGYSGMAVRISPDRWERMVELLAERHSIIQPIEHTGPPTHIQRASQLKPSPAYGAFPPEKLPAVLSKYDSRLDEEVVFDSQIFSKHNRGDIKEPWPGLAEAFDLYFSAFPQQLRTLTQEEAINGTPGLDGIDMGQSPGYPWVAKGRSRRSLFVQTPQGYVPTPELQLEIDKILEDPQYYYTTSLKDELRPVAKVKAGGTRLIEAAPIQAIVVGRMLFGGLFEHMHANPGMYGSAVGCDPDYHWTQFFWSFANFDEVFDLDYKGFDASLPTVCFDLLAQHLSTIISHPLIVPYINSISCSKHIFGKKAYIMYGGNPSGCVGTSIFNTIINNCCVISAMMSHPDFNPHSFRILAYGDDVIYAHSPTIHPSHLKTFFDSNTNLEVTPASKSGSFPDTSSIYTVTFLKRWFVPDEQRPMYIHPVVDPMVYQQSVMWLRGGDFADVCLSLSYLAHHSGPRNYSAWVERVRHVCSTVGVHISFLPYSVLQARWLKLVSC